MLYFNSLNLTFDVKQKYSNIMKNEILEATKIIQFFLNFLSKSQVSPTVREMIPCAWQLILFYTLYGNAVVNAKKKTSVYLHLQIFRFAKSIKAS